MHAKAPPEEAPKTETAQAVGTQTAIAQIHPALQALSASPQTCKDRST
jgi:hypothetical protein